MRARGTVSVASSTHSGCQGSNTCTLVHQTGRSPNLTAAAKSLLRRYKKGALRWREGGSGRRMTDFRGQYVAALEKRQTSITPALRAELAARYEAGSTIRELVVWCGAHRQTVVRHLVQAGIETRWMGLTDAQARSVPALYLDGLTLVEIAAQLGVAASTIRRRLLQQDVRFRPAVPRSARSA